MAARIRAVAQANRSEFDLRKFLKPAMEALTELCRRRFEEFGTAGNASKIKVIPMAEMARLYRAGALDPEIATAKAA
jgi:fructose-bisphosphate aldolase class II